MGDPGRRRFLNAMSEPSQSIAGGLLTLLLASLLVANLRSLDEEAGELLGKGFLDTTRIASSDPEMWADICVNNSYGAARSCTTC